MRSCDRRKRQRLRLGHRPASDPVPQLRREPGKGVSLLSLLWRKTLNQRSKSKKRHRWVNGGVGDFLLFQKLPTETLSTLIRLQVVPHLLTVSLVLDTEETIIIGDHHTEAVFFHLARPLSWVSQASSQYNHKYKGRTLPTHVVQLESRDNAVMLSPCPSALGDSATSRSPPLVYSPVDNNREEKKHDA